MAVSTPPCHRGSALNARLGKDHVQAPLKRQASITDFQCDGKRQIMNIKSSPASSPDTEPNYSGSQDLFQMKMNSGTSSSYTSTQEMVQSSPEDLSGQPMPAESNHISRGRKESTRQDSVSSVTSDHLSDGNSNDSERKKQKNREYAKQSRNRKAQKMKNLEEQIANLEATIQILYKVIHIQHEKLHCCPPNLRKLTLDWHPDGKKDITVAVECLLPYRDANFLQRLGNSSIGRIDDTRQVEEKVKVKSQDMQDNCQEDKSHVKFESYVYGTNGYTANNMSEENLELDQTQVSTLTSQDVSFSSQPSNDMLNYQLHSPTPNVSTAIILPTVSSNTGNGLGANYQTHMPDYFHHTKGSSARPGNEQKGQNNHETNIIVCRTPMGLFNLESSTQVHCNNSGSRDDFIMPLDDIKPSIGKGSQ